LPFTVSAADLAGALGSGDVPVLATPRAIAWVEAATCAVIAPYLAPELTTVGTRVAVDHRRPSFDHTEVVATAAVRAVTEALITFDVELADKEGTVLLVGEVHRAVVSRERFTPQ
jgi:predicted thioesterase